MRLEMHGRQVGGALRQIRELVNPEYGGEAGLRSCELADSTLPRKASKESFR